MPALAAGSDDLLDLPIQDFVIPGAPAESFAPMQRPDLVEPSAAPELVPDLQGNVGVMAAADPTEENPWVMKTSWSYDADSPVRFGISTGRNVKVKPVNTSVSNGSVTFFQDYNSNGSSTDSQFYSATSAFTVDLQTSCAFDQNDYGSIRFKGTPGFSLLVRAFTDRTDTADVTAWPDTVQLLVNGEPYGEAVPLNDGLDVEVPFNDESGIAAITSYGFRFSFPVWEKLSSSPTVWNTEAHFACWFDATTFSAGGTSALNGLLSGILGVIQSILNAIISLPGNIASAIGNILRDLFIPSEQEMQAILESFQTRLGEKLGFLYTAGSTIYDLVSGIYDALHESAVGFRFPGISVKINGQVHVIAPEQDVLISENDVVRIVQTTVRPVLVAVFALYLINLCHDMYECIISGYSYMDFLHRGRGGDD